MQVCGVLTLHGIMQDWNIFPVQISDTTYRSGIGVLTVPAGVAIH